MRVTGDEDVTSAVAIRCEGVTDGEDVTGVEGVTSGEGVTGGRGFGFCMLCSVCLRRFIISLSTAFAETPPYHDAKQNGEQMFEHLFEHGCKCVTSSNALHRHGAGATSVTH